MNRPFEAGLVVAAAVLAALGVALLGFAEGRWLDAQVVVTFLTFLFAFGGLHLAVRAWAPRSTELVLPIAAFLTAVGFVEIYRLDRALGAAQRWNVLVAAGVAAAVLRFLRTDGTTTLHRYRYLLLVFAIALLLLPLLPDAWPLHGVTVNGSRLWVRLEVPGLGRVLSFQPGEVAKVLLLVFLASYLAERSPAMDRTPRRVAGIRLPEPRHLVPLLLAAGISVTVLLYQRDLGASLLLFGLFLGVLYAATDRLLYPVVGTVGAVVGGAAALAVFPHVQRRFVAWLDPFSDFTGAGYQVAQGLFALGSGSLTGTGIGVGQPDLVPAAATDFIFAAVAEELGLAGSLAVLAAFALIVTAVFGVALRSRDRFHKLLVGGLGLLVGLQTFLILAGIVRLLPVTGIATPFLSYGGSALLAALGLVVVVLRVSHEETA